jgi:hypothetical protein
MRAEIALLGSVGIGIDIERVVRAGLHAGFASDATVAVEIDYAVVSFVERRDWADGHAGRILAVVTPEHGKKTASRRVLASLDVFDPGAERADRDFVFAFTCYSAGVTANAFAVIDQESVFHQRETCLEKSGAWSLESGVGIKDRPSTADFHL